MGTVSSLTNACLSRSTKLSSIKPLRFSNQSGSYFDYAEVANLGMYIHIPLADTIGKGRSHREVGTMLKGPENGKGEPCESILKAIDDASSAPWKTAFRASSGRFKKAAPRCRKTLTTLFIEGDTSSLSPQEIGRIVRRAHSRFDITGAVGFELPSTDATADRLRMLKELGISHLVIQFAPDSCKTNAPDVLSGVCDEVLAALKRVAFETVSLSFAFAQPGQSAEQLRCTIETALASGANHIAIRPHKSREAKRIESKSRAGAAPLVEFGCAATVLMAGCFKVNAYSVTEYGKRLGSGAAPAAITLKLVESERMIRYLAWTMHAEARVLFGQARLLRGVGRTRVGTAQR